MTTTFASLGLPDTLLQALTKMKISTPTPIQEKAIPICLTKKDLIACAQTGTGKTLAFSLPMVMNLIEQKDTMAFVLVPTRELATQVQDVLKPLLASAGIAAPVILIGGVPFGPQRFALMKNPRVIVATPGRLNDHLKQGTLRLNNAKVETLVLDEADRMLDMGFAPQIKEFMRFLPKSKDRQTLLFSATMPPNLRQLTKEFMRDAEQVMVTPPSTTVNTIQQTMVEVSQDGKKDLIIDELNKREGSVLVFARTKNRTDRLSDHLQGFGIYVDRIHGDRSQSQRKRAIDNFRSGRVRVLVATDIAARGIDISHVAHVINFDLPETREDYVHRIGRTGRAGKEGEALSFVSPEERKHWNYLLALKDGVKLAMQRGNGGGGRRGAQGGGGQRRAGGGRPEGRFAPREDRRVEHREPRQESREFKPRAPSQYPRPERSEHSSRPSRPSFNKRPSFGDRPAFGGGERRESRSERDTNRGFTRRESSDRPRSVARPLI